MRLIDADYLKNLPFERLIHTDFGETAIPIEEIDNAPTVDITHAVKVTTDDIKKLDNTDSFDEADYYHLNDMSDPECIVKVKENSCGACHHLIFKDHRHREGLCNLCRLHRCFDDPCVHEEEMQ